MHAKTAQLLARNLTSSTNLLLTYEINPSIINPNYSLHSKLITPIYMYHDLMVLKVF